jgi:hypothetical protein
MVNMVRTDLPRSRSKIQTTLGFERLQFIATATASSGLLKTMELSSLPEHDGRRYFHQLKEHTSRAPL